VKKKLSLPARSLCGLVIGAAVTTSAAKSGLTVRQIAEPTGFSMSRVSRIMTGHGPVRPTDVAVLSMVFGWPPELRTYLCGLATQTHRTHWLYDHTDTQAADMLALLESVSTNVTTYAPLLVPRRLRTTAYDQHIRSGAFADIERPAAPSEPGGTYFLDTHVLTRPGIPEDIRNHQLAHLLQRADDDLTLRVVPPGAHYRGIEPFRLLAVIRGEHVVHLEHHTATLLLHHHADTATYTTFTQTLQTVALDPAATRHLIAGLLVRPT